jgi:hypothetical protein
MKKIIINNAIFKSYLFFAIFFLLEGCKRDVSSLSPASYPVNGDVFIDGFSAGLNYGAFGGSLPTAFHVDSSITYNSSPTSMRFEVPDQNDPGGAYAGGAYFTSVGRDLSSFDALTFWVKASQPASVGVVGFGNDFGASKYQVALINIPVNSNWKKVVIPIPDPEKLKAEKGMFYYSAGPENGKGYTFWIDEVKFEKLGTISNPTASILNGVDKVQSSFIGVTTTIDGISAIYNLTNGVNDTLNVSPYYFNFLSSNPSIATVTETGIVSTVGAGTTNITATLGNMNAKGSLIINSVGNYTPAPIPSKNAENVISVFSDAYSNVPVDFYNGYWAPYQTTLSADFEVNRDYVLNYQNFNFVGIQMSSPTIDVSTMGFLHTDIFLPNNLIQGATFKIEVVDFGANGTPGGSDDKVGSITYTAPVLKSNSWVSLDIPFSSLPTLTTKGHVGQIIFSGTNVSSFYADNIYFWNNATLPITPANAAPAPIHNSANVISIFSNAYTNVAGTDLNPNWGQATVVSQIPVAGNNTLKYASFNYQGIQFGSSQNVSTYGFLHLDYYSANATALKVYIISPGPKEAAYTLSVPTSGTFGWNSVDIPLSSFPLVDLNAVIQLKFDSGNGNSDIIFLDNIYFFKP